MGTRNPSFHRTKIRKTVHTRPKRKDTPIPRIQRVPRRKLPLQPPNKRHDIRIRLRLQARPPIIPQTVSRIARHKHLTVHLELVRVIRKYPGPLDDIGDVASHLGKVEGDEEFEIGADGLGDVVGVGDALALPFGGSDVES